MDGMVKAEVGMIFARPPNSCLVFHLLFLLLERPRMNTVPIAVAS
jgi:hypothetical protein